MNRTDMDRIERIKYMEETLNEASAAVKELAAAWEKYQSVKDRLEELSRYYGSREWREDFEADCNGELPADLKRGVLSEDAVYNLLMEEKELRNHISAVNS